MAPICPDIRPMLGAGGEPPSDNQDLISTSSIMVHLPLRVPAMSDLPDAASSSHPLQPSSPARDATSSRPSPPALITPRTSFSQAPPVLAPNLASATARSAFNVAIATASSPPADNVLPSPLGGGPTSGHVVIPPRPKPGRKPATDEPASKRKAQNRESQRAFRARKAAKITDLTVQIEAVDARHRHEMNEKIAEITAQKERLKQLESVVAQLKESEKRAISERDYWKSRHQQQEDAIKRLTSRRSSVASWAEKHSQLFHGGSASRQDSPNHNNFTPLVSPHTQAYDTPSTLDFGCSNCKSNGPCACVQDFTNLNAFEAAAMSMQQTPPQLSGPVSPIKDVNFAPEDFGDREIDFTAAFATKRIEASQMLGLMSQHHEPDTNCGFCTDDNNCLCRGTGGLADLGQNLGQNLGQSLEQNLRQKWTFSQTPARRQSTAASAIAPGSCDDCQKNPKQRAWCQRVAQLKASEAGPFGASPMSRVSSANSALDPMEPRNSYKAITDAPIGCSETFKLLDGRVQTDSDSQDWSVLKPISPSRTYSAMELDAAGVVATLSQTMGPLMTRKEDGNHIDLVRLAQAHRSAGASPRVLGIGDGEGPGLVPLQRPPMWPQGGL